MRISVLAIGRLRAHFRSTCDLYADRLKRYCTFDEVEVREAGRAPTVALERADEGARLTARAPAGALRVALAREGTAWSSADLAAELARWRVAARPVALFLGGSHGLEPSLIASAGRVWSLGPLTLPHELARVVVLEQLYRAWTIIHGEPYHKGRPD
jgi:23S rRNA (pseudouridine1915-N3)-methyltransferase